MLMSYIPMAGAFPSVRNSEPVDRKIKKNFQDIPHKYYLYVGIHNNYLAGASLGLYSILVLA